MEDHFRALFDAIAESAVLVDKHGRIVEWNAGATSLFGYNKKEAIGRSINLIYEHNHHFPKIIQETLTHHKKWSEETPFIRKNGVKGVCKTQMALLHHTIDSKPLALITHFNITAYKAIEQDFQETEKSLRESEVRFRSLAENSTDMISQHTTDGVYLYISPSCKTLLGYTPEELSSRSIYKYLHRDDINKLKKLFMRSKESKNYYTISYRIKRKDGEYRWFESNIRFLRDEDNQSIREIQATSRDITDRVLKNKARLHGQQQLAHVFRLSTMEEMASGMAHEISQPLAAIVNYTRGCVRYLEQGKLDAAQLIEIMQKAVTQAERAGEVIHRLKNFFCKGQVFKTPCKINSVIRDTVSLIRNDLTITKTRVDFTLAKNISTISVDKIQVQQVMLNLIQNAIDAMKETEHHKRRIEILSHAIEDHSIAITICDNGPGFPKDIINKVFTPFFTTKAHGRGMGLAICRSIIEAHGGKFSIKPDITQDPNWIRFTLPIN